MESQDIQELQQEVMEELGISMEELQEIIDKEVENSEWVRQRKQQLEELEQCMRHKEEEVAHVDQLIDDTMRCVGLDSEQGDVGSASTLGWGGSGCPCDIREANQHCCPRARAIDKCQTLAKELYSMMGLQYRDSSSEDEAPAATEVIEIPDEEDDDVMSVDSGWRRSSVSSRAREGLAWGNALSSCSKFLQSQDFTLFPPSSLLNDPALGKVAEEKPCSGGFPGRDLGWTLLPVPSSFCGLIRMDCFAQQRF